MRKRIVKLSKFKKTIASWIIDYFWIWELIFFLNFSDTLNNVDDCSTINKFYLLNPLLIEFFRVLMWIHMLNSHNIPGKIINIPVLYRVENQGTET